MQGLITAAGSGTRTGLNGRFRKEMLPIYHMDSGKIVLRPIVESIYLRMKGIGIKSIGIVLDPSDSRTIDYVRSYLPDAEILYQPERRGYGDAVLRASSFIEDDMFLLNAGDGLLLPQDSYGKLGVPSSEIPVLSVMKVDNPQRYGNASIEERSGEKLVTDLLEKPEVPVSNFAICAAYVLPRSIFGMFDQDSRNVELTPAIQKLIRSGTEVRAVEFQKSDWISVGVASEYVRILQRSYDSLSVQ